MTRCRLHLYPPAQQPGRQPLGYDGHPDRPGVVQPVPARKAWPPSRPPASAFDGL